MKNWSIACWPLPTMPYFFAGKWGAVLRNRRKDGQGRDHADLRVPQLDQDQPGKNKPFDQFVREILTATGQIHEYPAGGLVSRSARRHPARSRIRPALPGPAHRSVPAATIIRTRSGASRIIMAWRRFSRAST